MAFTTAAFKLAATNSPLLAEEEYFHTIQKEVSAPQLNFITYTAPDVRFREAVDLGQFHGTLTEIDRIIDNLKTEFGPNDYNLILRNCNHFSDAFVNQLLNCHIPGYVNRLEICGSMCSSCFLPPTAQAPTPGKPVSQVKVQSASRSLEGEERRLRMLEATEARYSQQARTTNSNPDAGEGEPLLEVVGNNNSALRRKNKEM